MYFYYSYHVSERSWSTKKHKTKHGNNKEKALNERNEEPRKGSPNNKNVFLDHLESTHTNQKERRKKQTKK